jgi:hypothetical protein
MGILYDIGIHDKSNTLALTTQKNLMEMQEVENRFWIELENGKIFMVDSPIKTLWVMRPSKELEGVCREDFNELF